ncbi:Ribonuclease R [bioreactor metagenome]|uniref:Ribonuclease R n=1 Tax=bioreactor metagenome TaxID=1076179 RepID=A0A645FCD4_9ZZZZ
MSLKSKLLEELEKKPRRLKELREKFEDEKKLRVTLGFLVKDGLVKEDNGLYTLRRGKSAPQVTGDEVKCKIVKLAKSFGFAAPVQTEEQLAAGGEKPADFFIPGRFLRGAMPGDIVLVARMQSNRDGGRDGGRGSDEGQVVQVLEENNEFVGTVDRVEGRLVVLPDRCPAVPLLIKKSADGGAEVGEKVAAEI